MIQILTLSLLSIIICLVPITTPLLVSFISTFYFFAAVSCVGKYQCKNGQCIDLKFRCDKYAIEHCRDGSDERHCPGRIKYTGQSKDFVRIYIISFLLKYDLVKLFVPVLISIYHFLDISFNCPVL